MFSLSTWFLILLTSSLCVGPARACGKTSEVECHHHNEDYGVDLVLNYLYVSLEMPPAYRASRGFSGTPAFFSPQHLLYTAHRLRGENTGPNQPTIQPLSWQLRFGRKLQVSSPSSCWGLVFEQYPSGRLQTIIYTFHWNAWLVVVIHKDVTTEHHPTSSDILAPRHADRGTSRLKWFPIQASSGRYLYFSSGLP